MTRDPLAGKAQFTRPFAACSLDDLAQVGGKVARLGELIRAGFPVNAGFVLTTDAYADFLDAGPGRQLMAFLADQTGDDVAALEMASRRIRQLIETSPISAAISDGIAAAYERLAQASGIDAPCVAVRSSATSECLARHSFAGQQESFLWVKGLDELLIKTRMCWSSLFTAQAMAYRRAVGFPSEQALIAVGVQTMVDARVAGVLFTVNPSNGDHSKIVIEANWGFGESVVAGEVDPDRYLVDKVTLQIIAETISVKSCEYQVNAERDAVRKVAVPAERSNAPCLSAHEVAYLAELAKRVEQRFGVPQDIEWAIDRHASFPANIVLLQSRPETTWKNKSLRPGAIPADDAVGYVMRNLMGRTMMASPGPSRT